MSTTLILILIGLAMFFFAGLGGTAVKIALRIAGIALVALAIVSLVI